MEFNVDTLLDRLDADAFSLMHGTTPSIICRPEKTSASKVAYAFEWVRLHRKMKRRSDGKVTELSNQAMRVLKRQPEGFWKVYRTIMN